MKKISISVAGAGLVAAGLALLAWNKYRVGHTVCAPDCTQLGRSSHIWVVFSLCLLAIGVIGLVVSLGTILARRKSNKL